MSACAQCHGPLNRSATNAVYCFPCARQRQSRRIAPPDRRRNGDFSRLRVGGQIACVTCAVPLRPDSKIVQPRHCGECRSAHRYVKDVLSGSNRAGAAVAAAKAAGRLRAASSFTCADCSAPAVMYDHRDYNEPLKVDPVCHSCNVMRGAAIPFIPAPLFTRLLPSRGGSERE